MKRSLIYRNPFIYRLLMFALYGREYLNRFKTIASFIESRSSVMELCCGFGDFYAYGLKAKQVDYSGVDISPDFVKYGLKKGIKILEGDINNLEFADCDYCVMISSLYHFQPHPEAIIKKMLAASGKNAIIAEPVKNLLNSKCRLVSRLALLLTNEGGGKNNFRFTEDSLRGLMEANFKKNIVSVAETKNGKEKIYILKNIS